MPLDPPMICTDLSLTRHSEGLRLVAYPDNGVAIGYGCHVPGIKVGDVCTVDQAEQWLVEFMTERTEILSGLIDVPVTQNQFNAMADWFYNEFKHPGDAASTSTLIRKVNNGDLQGAWLEFPRWEYVNHSPSMGLLARRRLEQCVWLGQETWLDYYARVHNQTWWPAYYDSTEGA